MVASQETLDALEELGLNMYERKIYSALISRGVSTAGELSKMTGVPRSRTYDVLESLAEKGFAVIKPSKPMKYVSVPPGEALENAKEIHKEEIQKKMDKLDKFKESEAIRELRELYDEGIERVEPGEMTGAVKGRHNIHKRMGNMIQSAESEIKLLTTEEGLNDLVENHMDLLEESEDAGVNIRIIAPITDSNQDAYEKVDELAEVRHLSEEDIEEVPEGRFAIVDDEEMTFSLTHEDTHPTQDTAFWSKSNHAASEAVGPLFEVLWNKSREL
ncbi:MAG: hypothetical protein MUP58_00910 [Candidatus Nanohaloarchaeota archaeon QJJ-9]|nr:hypothetical protein [Candidatus Nanohaloarchaeota archaeon QJJ-9]